MKRIVLLVDLFDLFKDVREFMASVRNYMQLEREVFLLLMDYFKGVRDVLIKIQEMKKLRQRKS